MVSDLAAVGSFVSFGTQTINMKYVVYFQIVHHDELDTDIEFVTLEGGNTTFEFKEDLEGARNFYKELVLQLRKF